MNGNAIKILAVVFMILEHSDQVLSSIFNTPSLGLFVHYTGRIVFPIFVFIMVEGFFKTSNREKYIKRVFTWAIIMSVGSMLLVYGVAAMLQVPSDTLFSNNLLLFRALAPVGKNILWSLGAGILLLQLIEKIKTSKGSKRVVNYLLAFLVSFFSLLTEASYHVVPLFLIFYFFYTKRTYAVLAYAGISCLFLIKGLMNMEHFWTFEYQWIMILAVPVFILYNGKKGTYNIKYLFYIVYPLHLWILFVIDKMHLIY